jgi:hypothetical protein
VTPTIKNIIGIEKALYVAKACQIQNIPPEKCESKLVSLFFLILKKLIFFFFFGKKDWFEYNFLVKFKNYHYIYFENLVIKKKLYE